MSPSPPSKPALTAEKEAAAAFRAGASEPTRQRNEAWRALNEIADGLRVVHENPKIVAAVRALAARALAAEARATRLAVALTEACDWLCDESIGEDSDRVAEWRALAEETP